MDKLAYIAMTGAKHAFMQQEAVANNLANASTNGFRATFNTFRALPVYGGGLPTNAYAVMQTTGANFATGPMQQTGRSLDAAIKGDGWFAVQTPNGEAYTRNGSFQIGQNGNLQLPDGRTVLGDGGPITIPTDSEIQIGNDGSVFATPMTGDRNAGAVIGRLKLVNPPTTELARGDDGLFRLKNGQPAAADPAVQVQSGMVEGSNVNVVESLVNMIGHQRQYDAHMKMIKTAEENDRKSSQIVSP